MITKAVPTPGEWTAVGTAIHAGHETIGTALIDPLGDDGAPISVSDALANARLFAASKDLLEALEWAERWMTTNGHVMVGTREMRAAITKARGES